jgi:hypothetical protein
MTDATYIVGVPVTPRIYKQGAVGTPKSTLVTFTLKKASDNTPITGKTVSFSTSLGLLDVASDATDVNGNAHVTLTSQTVTGWAVVVGSFAGDGSYDASTGHVEVAIYDDEPVGDGAKAYQVFVQGVEFPYVSGNYKKSTSFMPQEFTVELKDIDPTLIGAFEVQIFKRGVLDFVGRSFRPKRTIKGRMTLTGISNHWKLMGRLANESFTTTDPGAMISALLTKYPCGVSPGSIATFGSNVPIDFVYDNLLSCLQRIQSATAYYLRLNLDDTLDFASDFGSVVGISFVNGANITDLEAEDDFSRVTSRTILIGANDTLVSTKTDPTALAEVGLVEEVFYDKSCTSQVTLDLENQKILDGKKTELQRYTGTVIDAAFAVHAYDLFDYVSVTDPTTGLSGNYRVAEVTRDLKDDDLTDINLSNAALEFQSVFTTIDEAIKDINDTTFTDFYPPDNPGDIPYSDATNNWDNLSIGDEGQILVVASGMPTWSLTPTSGALIYGASTTTWAVLDKGDDGQILTLDAGFPIWKDVADAIAHHLLSDIHDDTLTDDVLAGDTIIGNATPKWSRLAKGVDGQLYTMTSGLPSWNHTPSEGSLLYGASTTSWAVLAFGVEGQILTSASGLPSWGLTPATGSLIYGASATAWAVRAAGTNGQLLEMVSDLPAWGLAPTAGSILYGASTTAWAVLAKSTDGKILTLVAGFPAWGDPSSTVAHMILSSTHTDTVADTVVKGDFIFGNATPKWERLGIGTTGQILTVSGGLPVWADATSTAAHAMLSATHTDTLVDTVVAGDLIFGNATPKWSRLAKGPDGQLLVLQAGYPAWNYTPSTGCLLYGASSSAWAVRAAGTTGYVLTMSGGVPVWAAPAVFLHNLLDSASHNDTLTGSPVAGDVIFANSTPKWARLAKSTDGKVLTLVAGYPSWQTPAGGSVGGSGTIGYLAYWTATTTLGNSPFFYDSGTGRIGFGTATPGYLMDLIGSGFIRIGGERYSTIPSSSWGLAVSSSNVTYEVDFWNLLNNAAISFQFWQKTAEATATEILRLTASKIGFPPYPSVLYGWPSAFPTGSAKVLQCDLSGNLTWVAAGGVSGGTLNYVPIWTSTTTLGSAALYMDTGISGNPYRAVSYRWRFETMPIQLFNSSASVPAPNPAVYWLNVYHRQNSQKWAHERLTFMGSDLTERIVVNTTLGARYWSAAFFAKESDWATYNTSSTLIGIPSLTTDGTKVYYNNTELISPAIATATILAPSGAINVIVMRVPIVCTVTNVRGYRIGGSGATINARRNGSSNHLASNLSLTSANAWMDGGAVQNTAYAVGDKLEIMIVTVSGSPTQVAVQVDFSRP